MKKIIQIISTVIMIIATLMMLYIMLLYPKHKYPDMSSIDREMTVKKLIYNVIPKEFLGKDNKFSVELNVNSDELRSLIVNNIENDEDIENIDVIIENNNINIYAIKKYFGLLPVELHVDVDIKFEDDKYKLLFNEIVVGKINCDVSNVLEEIEKLKIPFMDVRSTENEIILEDSELKDSITVESIVGKEDNLKAELSIRFNNLEDFLKVISRLSKI